MDRTVNGPRQQANLIIEDVWFNGEDDLLEGEAVCYDTDHGTATEFDGRRHNNVDRPSLTNNKNFAGVALADYSGKTGGRRIRIACPGSKGALIALGQDVTINQAGVLTFIAGASGSHRGRWYAGNQRGRGAAEIRQTVTALIEASMSGGWSLSTTGLVLTVSDTTGLNVGDTVVLVGGEIEDGGGSIVPGKYTIAEVSSPTTVTLSSSALTGTAGAALACTGFAYTGNPKAQVNLLEGDECGGCEFISSPNAGTDDQEYMVGGLSYILGNADVDTDVEIEFADGTYAGELKGFVCINALGDGDFVIDLATSGIKQDGSTALAEVEDIDTAGDAWFGIFDGVVWHTLGFTGATEA